MDDVENILNDEEFFGDTIDKPNESVEQHMKQECLNGVTSSAKTYLLRGKQK